MEILPVSTSNSTAVGDLCDPIWIKLVSTGYRFGPVYELTTQSAIENRFGGNAATKITQKNLLKQQYENLLHSA
ncbi:hypothetical protein Tco_0514195 [Tanacetum coccineum]